MLPLLLSSQIREADAYTIAHEPIGSVDLMERAAKAFVGWFVNHFPEKRKSIAVYCGTGNNGGDGLAIARILSEHGYQKLDIKIARFSSSASDDFVKNQERVERMGITLTEIKSGAPLPVEDSNI